jgi:hypothetical protein
MGGQTGEKMIEMHYFVQSEEKFGQTDKAHGGDDVASANEFFNGAFGKYFLE